MKTKKIQIKANSKYYTNNTKITMDDSVLTNRLSLFWSFDIEVSVQLIHYDPYRALHLKPAGLRTLTVLYRCLCRLCFAYIAEDYVYGYKLPL